LTWFAEVLRPYRALDLAIRIDLEVHVCRIGQAGVAHDANLLGLGLARSWLYIVVIGVRFISSILIWSAERFLDLRDGLELLGEGVEPTELCC
jgi:hypothetical protein